MRQLILDLLPETPPTLDNFVAGGNVEAVAAFTGWLAGTRAETSFCLWGDAGSGSSHLLLASGFAYTDAALDPALMFWVLATLTDTVIEVDRRYLGTMRQRDREQFYDESLMLAEAFGIPEKFVPGDLAEFRVYMADTVRTLRPDDDSREIARSLLQPGLRWVPDLAFVPLEWITTELLPTPLRRRLWIDDLNSAQLAAVRSARAMSRWPGSERRSYS